MKKTNLLNAQVSRVIAAMGHTDVLCISDAGLPVPEGVERIDLAVSPGMPPFLEVLRAVMSEFVTEGAVVAAETKDASPAVLAGIREQLGDIPVEFVPHEEFKALSVNCKAVVRTGEFTPYANVLLRSGVPF